jgi:PqqD family protein of HPr-rel-A system
LRWHIGALDDLTWQDLDGEIVVRNDLTGSTHLFDSLAAELLHTLISAENPLSADELAARLAAQGEAPGELSRSIEAILSDFQRLGLAEPSD